MARMKGISDQEASLVQGMVFRGAKGKVGAVPEPLRIMARSGGVMWASGLFELAIAKATSVNARLRDLASLKVASLIGCVF